MGPLDLLRLVHVQLIGVVVLLVVLFVVIPVAVGQRAMQSKEGNIYRRIRKVLSIVAVSAFVVWTMIAVSVNSVPRGELDRSVVDERARDLKERVNKPAEPAKGEKR